MIRIYRMLKKGGEKRLKVMLEELEHYKKNNQKIQKKLKWNVNNN